MPYADPEKQKQYFREYVARKKAEGTYKTPVHREGYGNEYYHKNRDRILENRRKQNALKIEKLRDQRNAWARNNPEKVAEQRKRQRAKNGIIINQKLQEFLKQKRQGTELTNGQFHKRRYYERHAEQLKKKARDYEIEHPEKRKEACKRRYEKYRDHFREYLGRYGSRSPRRVAIYRKWDACGGLCYICGTHLELNDITVDHVYPAAKGGTNDIQNLMPAHKLCNIRKRDTLNYPCARRDLIKIAEHVQAIPRNLTAQVRPEWESRRMRTKK